MEFLLFFFFFFAPLSNCVASSSGVNLLRSSDERKPEPPRPERETYRFRVRSYFIGIGIGLDKEQISRISPLFYLYFFPDCLTFLMIEILFSVK